MQAKSINNGYAHDILLACRSEMESETSILKLAGKDIPAAKKIINMLYDDSKRLTIACWPLSITHAFIWEMLPNSTVTATQVDRLNAIISRSPAAAMIHLSCCALPILIECRTVTPTAISNKRQVIGVMLELKTLLTKESVASIWAMTSGIIDSVVAKQLTMATLFPR